MASFAPPVSSKTILVVEDEPALRFMISDVLREDGGYTVVELASGDQALSYLQEMGVADCVFTDIRMPGSCDGLGLTRYILETRPEVKVIMTSGNLLPSEQIGQVPFMPKPYDLTKVLDQISALVN